jgi:hypothetical protein
VVESELGWYSDREGGFRGGRVRTRVVFGQGRTIQRQTCQNQSAIQTSFVDSKAIESETEAIGKKLLL